MRFPLFAAGIVVLPALAFGQAVAPSVAIHWLDAQPPAAPVGVQWGTPWPRGALSKNELPQLTLTAGSQSAIPTQTWPLAYWPDGSIKWTGHAITVTSPLQGPFTLARAAAAPAQAPAMTVNDTAAAIELTTGRLHARFPKSGAALIDAITVGERTVAQNARLTLSLEDRSQQAQGVLKTINFSTKVTKATLEQTGPLRSVVKVEGTHAAADGRTLLPFVVRFYVYANTGEIRIVHSFIFDGDQEKDFVKSLGITFSVPFQEELHNRHVRLAGDIAGAGGPEGGFWCQPVRLLPGYRNALTPQQYADHLAGKRMPPMDQFTNRTAMESVAVYNDMKLSQPTPNGFSIDKRTTDRSSWLHVNDGKRSLGLALLGDVSGGIAVGMKDFWQKYPTAFEVRNAAGPVGDLTAYFWSPDASAMDMRTYDEIPHGLATNYEDWKPGWGTATGVANTSELTLWAFSEIPSNAQLAEMAKAAAAPPLLVSSPEYYHDLKAFGIWSLPDRSSPTLVWVEDQLDQLYTYYRDQVDERSWYGLWNFGDVMHNYDIGRHDWRYDVGGWAWANTELMPDMFLWTTFLRTGKPDAYRMAAAMTRHTSEVDAYHIGPFAPMGSRHNVNHWGDGAKQPRASHAMLKRYMYYLSGGDERLGDLMREQLDADITYAKLQQFNGSHYVPTQQPPFFRLDGNPAAPSPAELAAMRSPLEAGGAPRGPRGGGNFPAQTYSDGKPMEPRYANVSFNLEWISYSINWATEWERTGDPVWRDRVLAGMKSIAARANGGPLGSNYFDIIFGGPEIMFDQRQMFDVPEFWEGFTKVMEAVSTSAGGQMTNARGAAYAAALRDSQAYGNLAWNDLVGTADITKPIPQNNKASSPNLLRPVTDPVFLGSTNGWQLHGVASIQWALNAIETLELAKPYLKSWETARLANQPPPGGLPPAPQGRGGAGGGARGGGRGRGAAPAPAEAPAP
jgi:hypothetical protein